MKDVSVGVVHALALTENGEVYAWGKKEYAHMTDCGITEEPCIVTALSSSQVIGISAGPTLVSINTADTILLLLQHERQTSKFSCSDPVMP